MTELDRLSAIEARFIRLEGLVERIAAHVLRVDHVAEGIAGRVCDIEDLLDVPLNQLSLPALSLVPPLPADERVVLASAHLTIRVG